MMCTGSGGQRMGINLWLAIHHYDHSSPPTRPGAQQSSPAFASTCNNLSRPQIPNLVGGRDRGLPLLPATHASEQQLFSTVRNPHSLNPSFLDQHDCAYNTGDRDLHPSKVDARSFLDISSKPRQRRVHSLFTATRATAQPYNRSLIPHSDALTGEMTSTISPPDSPPDLSGSKSSKSSSTHSSSHLSNAEGLLSDISNFEDIGLEDHRRSSTINAHVEDHYNVPKRPTSRVVPLSPGGSLTNLSTIQVPMPRIPGYPNLHKQVSQTVNSGTAGMLHLPKNNGTLHRGFTSPSLPAFLAPSPIAGGRNRSTSPKHRVASLTTSSSFSRSVTQLSPSSISPRSSLPPPSRRSSWQPNRKSIQELEAEYDHSDEDLPDEASLWNVPMSPRPPEERHASFRSSAGTSPERDSQILLPPPLPLSHTVSAPSTSPRPEMLSKTLPRMRPPPPRTSSLHASTFSASNPTSPKSRTHLRSQRAKSWTLAMAELSEEARVMNQILDYHAEMADIKREENLQNGVKIPRPSLDAMSRRSVRNAVQLPPIQTGSLDFMPISKEKEAILSRTRPSWLPPKDPKEEKRHLKEYQRMMAKSIEADKKRDEKVHVKKCEKDDSREGLNKMWEDYVFPKWDKAVAEESTRELWWRGVSPRVRGQVWQRAVGNQLALTEQSYDMALQRAKDVKRKLPEEMTDKEKLMKSCFEDINRDANAAFPDLNLFQTLGPMRQDLMDICEAYVCYRSDIGFVYGVQLIAAMLLLQLEKPWQVFALMANCFNRSTTLAFLSNDTSAMQKTFSVTMGALMFKSPRLYQYLFQSQEEGDLGMSAEEVFEPMLRTLFSNALDLEKLVRFWDCWVFEGDKVLIRTAVAVLGCLQSQIFALDGDVKHRKGKVVEMLNWGPSGRRGGYWSLDGAPTGDDFMTLVRMAGKKEKVQQVGEEERS